MGKAVSEYAIPAATLPGLKKFANRLGAAVEDDSSGRYKTFQVIAPDGKTWACDPGLHMLKVEFIYGDSEGMFEAICDAIERMTYGLEDCPLKDCEFCNG